MYSVAGFELATPWTCYIDIVSKKNREKKIILPQVCFISRCLIWPLNDIGRRKLIYFF